MAMSKKMTLTTLKVPGLKGGTKPLSSIPLILPDNFEYDGATMRVTEKKHCRRTKLCVVPEAAEMLKTIKDPVSILAICGPTKTGKSYILSRCLGRPDAFELGHHMDPKTFGIWIGTTALKGTDRTGKPIQLLFMDTEGIDYVSPEQKDGDGIFVLTILLSSMLVYNSLHSPHIRDLDKLACFSRLVSSIQIKQGEDIDISDDEYLPDLLWLLRDVNLILPEGADGKPMDPTEYIKKRVLKGEKKLGSTAADETAEAILHSFPNIEAYTLPAPHSDPRVIMNIAANTDNLCREFETRLQVLVDKLIVYSTQKPKRGFDKMSKVTGFVLSLMVEEYVKAINDRNAIPEMKRMWDTVMDQVVRESIEELVVVYVNQMHAIIEAASMLNGKKEPMEVYHCKGESTLMSIHSMVFDGVNKRLREKLQHFGAGLNISSVAKQFQDKLVQYELTDAADGLHQGREVCGGELKHIMDRNYVLSEQYCTNLYHTLFEGIKDKVEHHVEKYNFEACTRDVERLNAEYNRTAKGPAKVKVMQKMDQDVTKIYGENVKKLESYHKKALKAQEEAKEKEQEARKIAEERDALRNESIMRKEQHQKNLNEMRNSMAAQIKQMEQEEKECKEKDMKQMQDLQESNFKFFASSIQELNSRHMDVFTKMMDQMRENQEKQAEETRGLIEALRPPAARTEIPMDAQLKQAVPNTDLDAGCYSIKSTAPGVAFILNNKLFPSPRQERFGSEEDVTNLKRLFDRLGFQTYEAQNLAKKDLLAYLDFWSKMSVLKQASSCVISLMSHGQEGYLLSSDGENIPIQDLVSYFNGNRCPAMAGKPKMFLIQACRGKEVDTGAAENMTDGSRISKFQFEEGENRADANAMRKIPAEADIVLAYATTPGYVSWRNAKYGSWFIHAFCKVFQDRAGREHVLDLLVKVNSEVSTHFRSQDNMQMPQPVVALRKKWFMCGRPE